MGIKIKGKGIRVRGSGFKVQGIFFRFILPCQSAPKPKLSPGKKKKIAAASYGHLITRASPRSWGRFILYAAPLVFFPLIGGLSDDMPIRSGRDCFLFCRCL